jgi:hypothetical protein
MELAKRLSALRIVLLIKIIVNFSVWAIPGLIAPAWFLSMFGLEMPANPIYLRLVGALTFALGVAYCYAYKDPIKNKAIVMAGIIDNGLIAIIIPVLHFTGTAMGWYFWATFGFTAFFCLAFILLFPREE